MNPVPVNWIAKEGWAEKRNAAVLSIIKNGEDRESLLWSPCLARFRKGCKRNRIAFWNHVLWANSLR